VDTGCAAGVLDPRADVDSVVGRMLDEDALPQLPKAVWHPVLQYGADEPHQP
jgi:hypothetical protein